VPFLTAGLATLVLALVHVLVPPMRRRIGHVAEGVTASIGGGVAAAYVFLHLLPELARGNREVAEVLGDPVEATPAGELLLFVVALAGFLLLYGLDHVAAQRSSTGGVFGVHLGAYAAYNVLITYALPTRFDGDVALAVLFVVAMALHFVLSDRALSEHYTDRFARVGRPVLVAALVVGYLLAWLLAPTRTTVVSTMMALLAGFILYNVFRDELPGEKRLRFPAFAASAGAYAILLLVVAAAET
jgi:hypothetical protein